MLFRSTQVKWQFFSPQLTTAANATYAAGKGFAVLSSIGPGEGYWVNASAGLNLPVQTGAAQNWSSTAFAALPSGFNLLAHNNSLTPTQFNAAISATPPATGTVPTTNFRSLWAWDTTQAAWYFYAPSIESTSGLAGVKTFANTNYRLHFQDAGKLLGPGVGFWVDKF